MPTPSRPIANKDCLLSIQATINLNALRHNLQQARQRCPEAKLIAVIKADAYGHGMPEVARALDSADALAVARLDEALLLRESGISSRLLVMGGVFAGQGDSGVSLLACSTAAIDIVIHSLEQVEALMAAELPQAVCVWLKYDSGMHRLGLDDADLQQAYHLLHSAPQVTELVLMTHFSSADASDDKTTVEQQQRFAKALESLAGQQLTRSSCNSAAIIKGLAQPGEWLRPGIMLYGANPLSAAILQDFAVDLIPAMTLSSNVIAVRNVAVGETVGYNGLWRAARPSIVATVAAGYGDGYPRHAPNGTPVLVNGRRATLAGRVSMDMISVDVSDCGPVSIGDPVTLWGEGLPAEEIAEAAQTISYELFTGVTKRVPRIYQDD